MKKRFTRNINDDDDSLKDEWNGIFIQTGGIGRLIEDFVRGGSTSYAYSASAKDYLVNECIEKRILLGIYRCASLRSVGFKSSFDWMASLPVSSLFESDDKERLKADKKTLYKMADHGLIRYYDDLNEIAFANPLIFWETDVHSRSNATMRVNFDELQHLALFRLTSSAQKAESICLRFLAEKALCGAGFNCKYSIGASVGALFLPDIGESPDNVVGRLWKETLRDSPQKAPRDALGADATLIEKTEEKYIVHRLQLKLSSGRAKNVTKDTIDAFKRNEETARKIYNSAGFSEHVQRWYLAATHDFDPEDRDDLAKSNITLIDRAMLAGVWPDEVKRILGKPYA